jgi:hypothetical protein
MKQTSFEAQVVNGENGLEMSILGGLEGSENEPNYDQTEAQQSFTFELAFALGSSIYEAAKKGAEQGYNRSTDDYSAYREALEDLYETMLKDIPRKKRREIERNTKKDWRRAYLPVFLLMRHEHKCFEPCEPHARIMLEGSKPSVIDIPWDSWLEFKEVSERLTMNF